MFMEAERIVTPSTLLAKNETNAGLVTYPGFALLEACPESLSSRIAFSGREFFDNCKAFLTGF